MTIEPATDEALFALEHRIKSARKVSGCTALMLTPDEVEALLERIREEIAIRDTAAWLSTVPSITKEIDEPWQPGTLMHIDTVDVNGNVTHSIEAEGAIMRVDGEKP